MHDNSLNPLHQQLKPLCSAISYFQIFSHPLTMEELHHNAHYQKIALHDMPRLAHAAVESGLLAQTGHYFHAPGPSHVERRVKGTEATKIAMKKAEKFVRIIAACPFVHGVMLSGSISKGYMDEHADVDYFIVAQAGRLWMCRTLLTVFKKIFLFNSHKYFCINYFVDTNSLEIMDKNIFTATEVVYLKSVYNINAYQDFQKYNQWAKVLYYPNFTSTTHTPLSINRAFELVKKMCEKILATPLFNFVEFACHRVSLFFWKIKFKKNGPAWYKNHLMHSSSIAKHHPNDHKNMVMLAYEKNLQHLYNRASVLTSD